MYELLLIYPRWPKIPEQTTFHLPPHGPICMSASVPDNFNITFIDENVDEIDFDLEPDLVMLSMMLTCQMPRGLEIAQKFRAKGIKVIAGGIATMLHSEEVACHVDSCFLGETEDGRLLKVLQDWENGSLAPLYNFMSDPPPIESVGPARRDILNYERYTYRGVKMVDLVHASRGCRFNCFPCSTAFLGGRKFRPRPISKVIEELESIDNSRLFFVDNSLAQDREWVLELFDAIAPLKRAWISHPICDDDEAVKKAYDAGCWYVYQAVFDTSEVIRNRIKRLKDHGIGVEAAVLLGTDNQDVDYIKRLVDFLLEVDVDMAEFSILTPFPHAPITEQFQKEGRILHTDWSKYTTTNVVFQPKHMTPDELLEMYQYAWREFYRDVSQHVRMAKLFSKLMHRQIGLEEGRIKYAKDASRSWQKD